MSFIKLPLENSDARPPKRYKLSSGKTKIKAEIEARRLKLTTTTQKRLCKNSATEKLVTKDKLIYKDKLVKAPYIPKRLYLLIAANVVFAGWKLKNLFELLGFTGGNLRWL